MNDPIKNYKLDCVQALKDQPKNTQLCSHVFIIDEVTTH